MDFIYFQIQDSSPGQGGSKDYSLSIVFITSSRIPFENA